VHKDEVDQKAPKTGGQSPALLEHSLGILEAPSTEAKTRSAIHSSTIFRLAICRQRTILV
jgi:hypothetical protein